MKCLAIDLGSTSGWAVVNDRLGVPKSGHVPDSHFVEVIGGVIQTYNPENIVCEEPILIRGPLGATLRDIADAFRQLCPNAIYVRPSDWKPHPMSKAGFPGAIKVKSIHERDAICIGRWFVKTRLQGSS